MKAIAGLVFLDGVAPEASTIIKMLDASSPHPIEQHQHHEVNPIMFGYAHYQLTAQTTLAPFTHDGSSWIVADARLDEHDALLHLLNQHGYTFDVDVTDTELILCAYHIWGTDCVDHLLGDFAFAIWDGQQQALFCARDHFGLRPLVYAYVPNLFFAFASTASALLAHPLVNKTPNDARIADFLIPHLEGRTKQETFYQAIKRLPPAHTLMLTDGRVRSDAYWQLSVPETMLDLSDDEFAEAYQHYLGLAVESRLQPEEGRHIGIMLSGGIDSTTIAWVAHARGDTSDYRTFSAISNDDNDVETTAINTLTDAIALKNIKIRPSQMATYFDPISARSQHLTNLFASTMQIPQLMYAAAAENGISVMLDGVFGDEMVATSTREILYLMRDRRWRTALRHALDYADFYHLPRWYAIRILWNHAKQWLTPDILRYIKRALVGNRTFIEHYESLGIQPDFIREQDLYQKAIDIAASLKANSLQDFRVMWLNHANITGAVERYDHVARLYGIEARHPYLDKRLVTFCMQLPAHQLSRKGWSKFIVRHAFRGKIPDSVLWRQSKTDLAEDFTDKSNILAYNEIQQSLKVTHPALGKYIKVDKLTDYLLSFPMRDNTLNYRIWVVFSLNRWLWAQNSL